MRLIVLAVCLQSAACYAGIPLVEFIQQPVYPQQVAPGQSNMVFYTLRNNTRVNFPLTVRTSSPYVSPAAAGNTCGTQIAALSTCVLPFIFTAPSASQTVTSTISVNYQGRAPLTDTATYNVSSGIMCTLLSKADYQTQFCQQQYQNFLEYTPNVFNTSNVNVVDGQTLGGMIGIYQNINSQDTICYISCGLRALNSTPPDQNTIFELASVTKTFTASILGEKVYLGSVNPDVSVNPYLPPGTWSSQSYNLNTNEQPVTFQQLATFSGGVCYSDAPDVNTSNNYNQQQSDFIMDINLLNPASASCPGGGDNVRPVYGAPNYLPTHNFYSNSSVGLLAQVLMNIDGYVNLDESDFNAWICQHVTAPLGMNLTSACLPDEAHNGTCPQTGSYCNTSQWTSGEYASGYHLNNTNNTYQLGDPFPYVPWAGAGVLRSNVSDMVIYLKANLGINGSSDPDVINLINGMMVAHTANNYLPVPGSSSVIANIGSQSPLRGSQGYAWVCDPSSGDPNAICGKIGGHTNFRSFVGFSPGKQYGIVLLFNTGDLGNNGSAANNTIPEVADIGVSMIDAS